MPRKVNTWRTQAPSVSVNWRQVAFGGGRFVAVGGDNNSMVSTDNGKTWSSYTLTGSSLGAVWAITYGNGKFVAATGGGYRIYSSTDGITWTPSNTGSPLTGAYRNVAYGGGKFVAITDTSVYAYSTDGVNWTVGTFPSASTYNSKLVYLDGQFMVFDSANLYMSADGVTWTTTAVPSTSGGGVWVSLSKTNGVYTTLIASGSYILTSTDRVTWTRSSVSVSSSRSWAYAASGSGITVIGGMYLGYTTDGISIKMCARLGTNTYTGVAYGNGVFVAVGGSSATSIAVSGITNDGFLPFVDAIP